MTKKTDTPAIRFLGFSDTWEQRKLLEFGLATGGTSIESEFSEDGVYKVISIGSYSEDNVYRDQGIRAVRSDKTVNRILNKGDITMILNDKTASGNIIGRVLLIEESGVYVYNQRTERIEVDNSNYDSQFIYTMLNAPAIRDRIIKQSQGNTQIYVNWTTISQTDYLVPQFSEQRKIGEYFANLDHLITLHQREYEKLHNIKKSMLEKMFPKNGSNVPEIRFKGFTEAWEQRKLGEIGSVSMCRRIFKEQTSETGDIPFYKIGTFGADPDAFISRELFEKYKSKYPYPQKGDILISASGSIGRTVEFAGNNEYFQDSNIVWLNHDERLSNPFLKCFYSVVKWAGIEGSTIKRLYNDNILNTVICMPSVPEQKRIGLFFENLDHLITLHQRELEKLQNIKKSMLEKMFVSEEKRK